MMLENLTVVVTGSARGVGADIAAACARAGAELVAVEFGDLEGIVQGAGDGADERLGAFADHAVVFAEQKHDPDRAGIAKEGGNPSGGELHGGLSRRGLRLVGRALAEPDGQLSGDLLGERFGDALLDGLGFHVGGKIVLIVDIQPVQ